MDTAYMNAADADDPRYSRILQHARRAFLTLGYEGTSLEYIAHAASVGKPTIYTFFGSKEDLLERILQDALAAIFDRVTAPIDVTLPVDLALRGFAESFFHALYDESPDRPSFFQIWRLVVECSFRNPEIHWNLFKWFETNCFAIVETYLTAAIADGKFTRVDMSHAVPFFFEAVMGSSSSFFGAQDPLSGPELSRRIQIRVNAYVMGCQAFALND